MGSQNNSRFSSWLAKLGPIVAMLGAALILGLVVFTYLQTDVLRFRGIVLVLVLAGVAAVVRSEANAYVPNIRQSR